MRDREQAEQPLPVFEIRDIGIPQLERFPLSRLKIELEPVTQRI